jgi:hypothetical protein
MDRCEQLDEAQKSSLLFMSSLSFRQHVEAYVSDVDLSDRVVRLADAFPDTEQTWADLITFAQRTDDGPARKKTRIKLQDGAEDELMLTIPDLSFSAPIRKKLTLQISKQRIVAKSATAIELAVDCAKIKHVCFVPVPEKAVKQYNCCIFYDDEDGRGDACIVLTINEVHDQKQSLVRCLVTIAGHVYEPRLEDFHSVIPQPHRKKEPAVHAVAHRGSKEGFLFFLQVGILYGFKKPILFIPLADIDTISYNDILQRTFNLTVTLIGEGEEEGESIEFSMIDIANHEQVDQYVRKYKLQDASMSESRRAAHSKKQMDEQISEAADAIAAGVTGEHAESDEEADESFHDSDSHDGSTVHSDSSEAEVGDDDVGGKGSDNQDDDEI